MQSKVRMGNSASSLVQQQQQQQQELGDTLFSLLSKRCEELEKLLKKQKDATEEHCKALNEFLASSVQYACRAIHAQIMDLYWEHQQQGKQKEFRKNLPDTLRNILAECKYVLEVASLATSAKNPCSRWDSGEMHAIIDAMCLRVIQTYEIFEKELERAIKDKGIHTRVEGVLADIRQVILEMKNVLDDGTKTAYKRRVDMMVRKLGKALRVLDKDGKEQVVFATALSMDPRPLEDEIRELVQLMADSRQHGWKVQVDVYVDITKSGGYGHDYDNVVIRIRNAGAVASKSSSVQPECCLRCGLALAGQWEDISL